MVRSNAIARRLVALSVVLAASGCGSPPEQVQRYELQGQILGIRPERQEVIVKHGDIANFMPAMTMPFKVKDPALLEGRAAGDLVQAILVVGDVEAYLETLDKTGTAPLEKGETVPPPPPDILEPGQPVPETPLVDQNGEPRPLSAFRGHRVALTFIYSRCPIPDFCPLMNQHFAAVQRAIRANAALADVRLVSVTLDPSYDTPAVLKPFAASVGADPAIWTFLTGTPEHITAFGTPLGIYAEANPEMLLVHNLRTAVIDADGRLVKVYTGNEWTPATLLADLNAVAAPRP